MARVKNGDVLKTPQLRDIASKVIYEGTAVAHANGIALRPAPRQMFEKVLAMTSRNKSSMLQDIEAGRKTEIIQLNGSITRLGSQAGVSTPFNYLLTMLVLYLERSQGNL
ncbi:hypothetical protein E6H17_08260 [Candidatus Bathyarchaeota archaeon]|nr:MAG: hypothetical protein E6H17_08260 [Candidatus Bathyarchaeota archaeon]